MSFYNKFFFPFVLILISIIFFFQFFLKGLYPIPSDTLIGLYHPFRDLYSKNYPNGITFKNFLITDPIRQQYLWKKISIDQLKLGQIPTWNPYSFAGYPLSANIQSAPFYPFNLLMFLFDFPLAWSLVIFIQLPLASIFMYLYLRNLKLERPASLLGGFVFAFSGFSIAWLEWGTVIHTSLWIPLILLAIDRILITRKIDIKWNIVLGFALISSFLAGHLQVFFYVLLVSALYFLFRIKENISLRPNIKYLALSVSIAVALIFPLIFSTLNFINLSGREIDLIWTKPGWFIPYQHLIQMVIPDFFGNPSTLNYFGEWNYGEFISYVGIGALIFAAYAMLIRKNREVIFFSVLILFAIVFATPNPIAKLPFFLDLPFISTSQPTRLIFLIDFSLSVLAGFGLNYFVKSKEKMKIFVCLGLLGIILLGSLLLTVIGNNIAGVTEDNLQVAKRNIYFPVAIFSALAFLVITYMLLKQQKLKILVLSMVFALLFFDLLRFGWKFTPFTNKEYLFPKTSTLEYLLNQDDKNFRVMMTDARILPANVSAHYSIQAIEGYDPLILQRYEELISAINREKPDISPPFGFNRIVATAKYDSRIIDLLNVKYVLSLDEIRSNKLKKVHQEGLTKVYENKNVLPRAFFVSSIEGSSGKQESIEYLFRSEVNFSNQAVVEGHTSNSFSKGKVSIVSYTPNSVTIQTENKGEGFLVLLDSYYPTWKTFIRDLNKEEKIYVTDYNFRGVVVPSGNHTVEFVNSIL